MLLHDGSRASPESSNGTRTTIQNFGFVRPAVKLQSKLSANEYAWGPTPKRPGRLCRYRVLGPNQMSVSTNTATVIGWKRLHYRRLSTQSVRG
jgi:hypothetical protein